MNNPELYQQSNLTTRRDALDSFQKYAMKIKWKKNGKIIDIGCGDGSLTNNLLKLCIPHDYVKLVGCDISKRMVEYASEKYGDERTSFIVHDIGKQFPDNLRSQFDFVFSSYAIHWISQQELAFKNIYDVLAEDGSCLLNFLGRHPFHDVWRILCKNSKWSRWLQNAERHISPYCNSKDPQQEIRTMMEQIGFKNIEVTCEEKRYVYCNTDVVKNLIQSVNPFEIPANIFNDYIEDYLEEFRRMGMIIEDNSQSLITTFEYDLITVFANKM